MAVVVESEVGVTVVETGAVLELVVAVVAVLVAEAVEVAEVAEAAGGAL